MAPISNSFQCARLPNELLLHIKEETPLNDLRTHVCYYNTCRTIAGFYRDKDEEAFWKRSCLLSGITLIEGDTSFKDVAFECISKCGFCTYPGCGGGLLRKNAFEIKDTMKTYEWDPVKEGPYDPAVKADPGHPLYNEIFPCLSFAQDWDALIDWDYSPTRAVYDSTVAKRKKCRLSSHPLLQRSMATFPSLPRFELMYYYNTGEAPSEAPNIVVQSQMSAKHGVTIWDSVRAIRKSFWLGRREFTVSELHSLLECPFSKLLEASCYSIQDISRFTHMQGLWEVSCLQELSCDGIDWDNDGLMRYEMFFESRGEGQMIEAV